MFFEGGAFECDNFLSRVHAMLVLIGRGLHERNSGFVSYFLDCAFHKEVLFRHVVVFPFQDFLEAPHRVETGTCLPSRRKIPARH